MRATFSHRKPVALRAVLLTILLAGLPFFAARFIAAQTGAITLKVSPANVPADKAAEPQEFSVELQSAGVPASNYTVELTLPGSGAPRKLEMKKAATNRYTVMAAPITQGRGPKRLRLTLTYGDGAFTGETADQNIKVTQHGVMKLSELSRIVNDGYTRLTHATNGAMPDARIEDPLPTQIDLNGTRVTVDLRLARRVDITPVTEVDSAPYIVTVRQGNKTVAETSGIVALITAPAVTAAPDRIAAQPTITASPIQNQVTLKLSGPADDVIVAGGGRYLLFVLKQPASIAVFDVNVATVTHNLPMPLADVKVTAGLDKIVVWNPATNSLQRWSLTTMQREASVTIPVGRATVSEMAMGYASTGPLLVMTSEGPVFLDVDTLKRLQVRNAAGKALDNGGFGQVGNPPLKAQASADGSLFATPLAGSTEVGFRLLSLDGLTAVERQSQGGMISGSGATLPSSDGALLFTGTGIVMADMTPASGESGSLHGFPAVAGNYFVVSRNVVTAARGGPTVNGQILDVYSTDARRLLFTMPNIDELDLIGPARPTAGFTAPNSRGRIPPERLTIQPRAPSGTDPTPPALARGANPASARGTTPGPARGGLPGPAPAQQRQVPLPLHKRLFFVVPANLLVTVTNTNDELILRKVDVAAEMKRTGADFLMVESVPLRMAWKSRSYSYAIQVRSSRGGLTYRLDASPEGMTISSEGVLSWHAPPDAEPRSPVIISIHDAAGQEIYHAYSLTVH